MGSKTITRDAIGRNAVIGDLYDVRTDSFMDISILNESTPEDAIRKIKIDIPDVKCIDKESIVEKFTKLKIEPELQASVMANLISLEGYGKFFKHEKKDENNIQKSIAYTKTSLVEELVLRKDKMDELISRETIDSNLGTHFVFAITWGTKVVVTLEEPNSSDGQNVGENLKHRLTALVSGIQGVSVPLDDSEMSVEVFADVLPPGDFPDSLEKTEIYVKKTLTMMQLTNKKKGRPITYTLMPLWALNDYVDYSIPEQNIVLLDVDSRINVCITRFEDIKDAQKQINVVLNQFEAYSYCIPIEQIREGLDLKSKLVNHKTKMEAQLKKLVPAVRSGSRPMNCLEEMFQSLNYNSLLGEMNSWVNLQNIWLEKIRFVNEIKMSGVQHVGINTDFKAIEKHMKNSTQQTYVLFFGVNLQKDNEDYWEKVKKFYLDGIIYFENTHFVAIDLDVRPELALKEVEEKKIRICTNINGNYTNYDVHGDYIKEAMKCVAKSHGYKKCEKPAKRVELKLVCPGTIQGSCENKEYTWHCSQCNEILVYAFDNHFYCKCGKSKSDGFSFKCCSENHHVGFIPFQPRQMKELLDAIPPMNELNILVLGVTGVGKSTWLNAFVNYMIYRSLKEAAQNKLHSVTSSYFQLTDEKNQVHDIKFGEDKNENHGGAQSSTQNVRGHIFPIGNTLLRLIDTPGIGDTRGVEYDKENFANILAYLRTLDVIHGICILLMPNESKLHILFEFCIKELLTYLHRSAMKNIVFCFTHSRTTFYKPGDTRVPLQQLLTQNNIGLELNPSTMYCMDNESFRFLCAVNQKIEFKESVKNTFSESWNVTVEEINRLIEHIKKLEPHIINDTISLNDAKKNIICLTKPIADISANIQRNLAETEWKREILLNKTARDDELVKMLYIDVTVLESDPLTYPRTVCGSAKCTKHHAMAGSSTSAIEYARICHDHCQLKGVPVEIVGDRRIRECWAMNCGKSLTCRECTCAWDQHLHITYIQRIVTHRETVDQVQNEMTENKTEREQISDFIAKLEKYKKEQEDEQLKIIEVSVKFGRYLSKNAIVSYNDVIERYLDHLIEREKDKPVNMKKNEVLKRLEGMRSMYEVEVQALKQAMAKPDAEELDAAEFNRLRRELYALKHNGKQLQNAFEQASRCEEIKNEEWEQVHLPTQSGFGSNFSSHFTNYRSKSYNSTSCLNQAGGSRTQVVSNYGPRDYPNTSTNNKSWFKKLWKK